MTFTGRQWIAPGGSSRLRIVEDRPGVVEITTEALEQLLQQAGFTPAGEDAPHDPAVWPPPVQVTKLPGVETR